MPVDHAVATVVTYDGHDVMVMYDVAEFLLPPDEPVSRARSRELLEGLAGLHDVWDGDPVEGLCGVGARYALGSPAVHEDGEVDIAWYAFMATRRVDCSPDDLFDDYRAAAGQLDDDVLDLAALGTLAQFGWALPLDGAGDHFAWWISRARNALASL